jgi:hypothetical protein
MKENSFVKKLSFSLNVQLPFLCHCSQFGLLRKPTLISN